MERPGPVRRWLADWLPSVVAVTAALALVGGLVAAAVSSREPPDTTTLAWADAEGWAEEAPPDLAEVVEDAEPEPAAGETDLVQVTADGDESDAEGAGEGAIPDLPEPEPEAEPEPPAAPAEPAVEVAAVGSRSSADAFAQEFPVHAAARQTGDPATRHWAVLIGVNSYQGRTQDTFGSVPDALVMRQILLDRGWRDDHILVLTDGVATRDRIVRAVEWLARSTDERSTVVFSFSGHLRHRGGVTAVWPTDNQFIWADEFGRLMATVPAGRMWVTLQGCHAEGLRAPGLEGDGRIVTYSSRTAEKSYEDPEVDHSVFGYYVFVEGFRDGWGDGNEDGRVSVQEAFEWGAPRAHTRTADLQTPVIADGVGEPFHLDVMVRERSPAAQ